uniref:C2 domain-containing protein n=1 Tax=Ciona savignyi TaxID=51511 RepID=H2YHH5_CIOSA
MAGLEFTSNFNSEQSGGWNSQPVIAIELGVSCRNLIDADLFSKSDPMVVMYTQGLGSKEWREFGRTETIWNNLNPDFVKKFIIDYFFEERQAMRFDVYDVDSKSPDLSKHDFLGQAFCSLGEVVGSSGSRYEAPLRTNYSACWFPAHPKIKAVVICRGTSSRNTGRIVITAEELDSSKDVIHMQFNGRKLDKKDLFGKSDPFMVFCRCNENNSFTVCHKTEVKKNTLNPEWGMIQIPVRTLCNGDYDRTIKVEVYDWDRDGGHDLIGIFTTSVNKLTRGPGPDNVYECINPKKKAKKKKYKHSGLVNLLHVKIAKQFSFLDYIRGGTELNFVVAIDFTASNGNPNQPSSLHYIHPNQPNQYALAIQAVGDIVQDYDSDKLFPTFGFGARLPPDGRVSHEFALNFNPANPNCFGIQGVMEAYQHSIRSVQLYGPTNFSPIINSVSRLLNMNGLSKMQHTLRAHIVSNNLIGDNPIAFKSFVKKVNCCGSRYKVSNNHFCTCRMAVDATNGSQYYILLMITDGVISDMGATKEAIVNAARLPISIIIVGVGAAEFDAMEELDGDTVRVSHRGIEAERDIVQFVPFRDYIAQGKSQILSQARLAKDVLAEIPDQLVGYMKSRRLNPGSPPPQYTSTNTASAPV